MRRRTPRYATGGAVTAEKPPDGLETAASIDIDHGENTATIQHDIETAMASGDFHAQSDAYRRLAKAEMGSRASQSQPDDASAAFQKQIDALRKSEEIQHQRQADLSVAREHAEHVKTITEHIKAHPDMVKYPEILAEAANEVGLDKSHGYPVHTLPFFDLVKQNFERRMQENPPAEKVEPVRRKRSMESDDDPSPARRFTSAPVSREWYGDTMAERQSGERPGRITLTVEMKDMARRLGMSEKSYAEGLLEMRDRDKELGK